MNQVEVPPPVTALAQGCNSIAAPSSWGDTGIDLPSAAIDDAQKLVTMWVDHAGSAHRVGPASDELLWTYYPPATPYHFRSAALRPVGAVEALQSADSLATVVAALRRRSLDRTADRVVELTAPDHDEPGQPEIDLDSLKRAAVVMLEHPQWGEPEITLRDDRYLHLAWALQNGGRVAISFLPKGHVRFSALSAPVTTPGFLNIGGRHLQQPAIDGLRWFTDRIAPR